MPAPVLLLLDTTHSNMYDLILFVPLFCISLIIRAVDIFLKKSVEWYNFLYFSFYPSVGLHRYTYTRMCF